MLFRYNNHLFRISLNPCSVFTRKELAVVLFRSMLNNHFCSNSVVKSLLANRCRTDGVIRKCIFSYATYIDVLSESCEEVRKYTCIPVLKKLLKIIKNFLKIEINEIMNYN